MTRLDDMLNGAEEKNRKQGHTLDDAFAFGVDGRNAGTGVPKEVFDDDDGKAESICGACPECGERGGLQRKWGKDRVEIRCTECETELLEYTGNATPTGILNPTGKDGFSVRFHD